MAANLTVYDAVLKEDYAPALVEQLNNEVTLLRRLQRGGEESIQGRRFVIPVHYGRNTGVGARAEYGDLPTAGQQRFVDTYLKPAYVYGTIELSDPLMKATRADRGSFVRALQAEMEGLLRDFKKDVNRQLMGDGTGLLTACGTTSASTTVTVASTKKLFVGMTIDVLKMSDGTVVAANRTVDQILSDTQFVISGAAITTDSTHGIYRQGNRNLEAQGIAAIINSSGVIQELNPATAGMEWWAAYVNHNSGTNRSVSELLMQRCEDEVWERCGAKVTLLLTTAGVRRSYMNLLTSLKRFVNTRDFGGGFTALEYNDKPLVVDMDCDPNRIYFLTERNLKIYELAAPGWMDEDGAVLHRVSGKAAYGATYEWYFNLGTDLRRAHAVLKDITES